MDFFEKLGDTITTKGKEVSGKAKELSFHIQYYDLYKLPHKLRSFLRIK